MRQHQTAKKLKFSYSYWKTYQEIKPYTTIILQYLICNTKGLNFHIES